VRTKRKVLVVDDEPGVLRFISVSLSVAGYEVITTTSGEKALKLVESTKPDVMLLDVLMTP
jgi:CheY-like chemotaxis protein